MLKFVIVTQEDPFYIRLFFREFIDLYRNKQIEGDLKGVYILRAFNESRVTLAKRLYGLYGAVDFTRLLWRYGTSKLFSAAGRLGLSHSRRDIDELCKAADIDTRIIDDVNDAAFRTWLQREEIDLVVSVSAPQIFRKALLDTPRLGCINIHNGRLPEYRGMLPNFWQLYNGEHSSVMTIHTMGESLDTGEVLAEVETPIRPNMSLDDLIRETKSKSAHVLADLLAAYAENRMTPIRQIKKSKGAYYTFPKRQHAQQLRRNGYKLL